MPSELLVLRRAAAVVLISLSLPLALMLREPRAAFAAEQASRQKRDSSATAAAATDSLSLSWVFAKDAADRGVPFEAWLVVHSRARIARTGVLALIAGPSVSLWFPDAGRGCSAGAPSPTHTADTLSVNRDTLLAVCGAGSEVGTTHLIAQFQATSGATGQTLAVSEPLTIAYRFAPGAGTLAILTAIMGFVGGLLTTLVSKQIETRQSERTRVSEAQLKVLKLLLPEMTENRSALESYIAAPAGALPQVLSKDYNNLLGDAGLLAYLSEGTRKNYLAGVKQVYQEIDVYNDLKTTGKNADALIQAKKVVKRLRDAIV